MEWWYPEFSCQFLYTVTISLLLLCHVFGCTTRVSIITFYSFFISNTKRNLLHSTHLLCHPRMLSIIYLFLFLNFTFCLSITFHYFYSNNFLVLFFSFLSFFSGSHFKLEAVLIHFRHCASKCLKNVVRFFLLPYHHLINVLVQLQLSLRSECWIKLFSKLMHDTI